MDTYSIIATITTLVTSWFGFFQWNARRKSKAEVESIEIRNLTEAFEQLRIENNRLRDEIKELRGEVKQLRDENEQLRKELHQIMK